MKRSSNYALTQDSASDLIKIIEGPQHPNRQGLDPYTLTEIMDQHGVPGVSIAVIKDFKIHWAKGYGIADVETGKKVNTETLFQAASISKPVTRAVAIAAEVPIKNKVIELTSGGLVLAALTYVIGKSASILMNLINTG